MNVFIIPPRFRLGAWGIHWPAGKGFALSQPPLDHDPVDRSTLRVFAPCTACNISTYDCFNWEGAETSDLHASVQKLLVEFVWDGGW